MLRLMPRPLQFAFQSAGPPPARSLSGRLCRDASSSLPPSPDVGKFIRGHRLSDRPCGIAVSADAVRSGMLPPRGPLSPVRRIFGTPRHVAAPCVRCPPAPHSPGDQAPPPPGAAAATVQLRKPPPRPDAEAPRLRGDRSACGSCGDASRSPEARSSHGRSPPLSPESCGTPAPCGCSPVRKRLRTKHRGAV